MDIQFEIVNDATSYEPYHKPIITNLYLPQPLRIVGDKAFDFLKNFCYNIYVR